VWAVWAVAVRVGTGTVTTPTRTTVRVPPLTTLTTPVPFEPELQPTATTLTPGRQGEAHSKQGQVHAQCARASHRRDAESGRE
jgi:hypothetical protein